MDFERAAQRLAKDQSRYRQRNRNVVTSSKAKREAEYRKKQQERIREEREKEKKRLIYVDSVINSCNRRLYVKPLLSSGSLQLQATSIHGDGDKIALPPSVLEFLTAQGNENGGSPWTFRIGILNPDYKFPSSPLLGKMTPPQDDDNYHEDSDDEENDDAMAGFVDELSYKYLSYTHGTVVEFTQDEGHVGLPANIAAALLDKSRRRKDEIKTIPVTRTVDPSKEEPIKGDDGDDDAMIVVNDDDEEKTPGHLAWGAFDVPSLPVEITLLKLPKGRGCTLVPTPEAIRNGFYNLKDVKLVLEQSLIRTRATLSVGDTVHTWHRGVKFDLDVTKVSPAFYQSVTCINTDIEVEIGETPQAKTETGTEEMDTSNETESSSSAGYTLAGGRVLSSDSKTSTKPATNPAETSSTVPLLAEPPAEQKEGVCAVQIRGNGVTGRRRFDTNRATMADLFDYAASIVGSASNSFRLVTRFPRRVFAFNSTGASTTMAVGGIQMGQELFMVEMI